MTRKFRWVIFWLFIAIDIVLFINCILFFTGTGGIFYSRTSYDTTYNYTPNGYLTGNQFIELNGYLTDKGQSNLTAYIAYGDGNVEIQPFSLMNNKISDPQDYDLVLKNISYSQKDNVTFGVCVLVGGGCFIGGGAVIAALYNWAKS